MDEEMGPRDWLETVQHMEIYCLRLEGILRGYIDIQHDIPLDKLGDIADTLGNLVKLLGMLENDMQLESDA